MVRWINCFSFVIYVEKKIRMSDTSRDSFKQKMRIMSSVGQAEYKISLLDFRGLMVDRELKK